jgi:hypothetical protein
MNDYMKRIFYILAIAAIAAIGCKKDNKGDGIGTLEVNLSYSGDYIIAKSGNADVSGFTVSISRKDGWSKNFDTYASMPEILELGAGEYTITASSPTIKDAAFDLPIYGASQNFKIRTGEVTPISLVCTLQNMKVSFVPSENFKKELSNYTVTVTNAASWTATDVGEKTLFWTKADVEAGKAGYFSVAPLSVKIDGYRAIDGSEAHAAMNITNVAAKDHHIIKLDAKVTGSSSLSLIVNDSLNEKNSDINIPGWEEIPIEDEPQNPGGNTDPQPGTAPTLLWEANPDFSETPISSNMDVNLVVKAPEKIKTFTVSVDSYVLSDVIAQLAGRSDYSYAANGPFDMDLINDTALIAALDGMNLGIPTADKLSGQTSVDFSLSNLIPMISVYNPKQGSKHIFTLKVSDLKGGRYEKALTFYQL